MYAIITGASSGIGKEISTLLAARKYNLILVARRKDRLELLKSKLEKKYSISVYIEVMDLNNAKNCFLLFEKYKAFPLSILVNNAGFGKVGHFSDCSLQNELDMIQTNIVALHILTKLFIKNVNRGNILNVASMAAYTPSPVLATYGATKSYVYSLSRAINYELKKQHKAIHITTLCPGPVDTEFHAVANASMSMHLQDVKSCAKAAVDGMFHNKSVVIPGFSMRLLHILIKISPVSWALPLEYLIQSSKKQ
ncbi:hypothetical protein SAMN05661086_03043 [Anaeromicropila populeti]|uniref:Short-chain dehydrogenase n=2 Tax=Anaeromicropila populeti TaxID=37658 RepID=A0A1I6L4J5_9FIRM|nr:hypothetical protein SAMN05661086_03043 [Anaeromicropila populeti]